MKERPAKKTSENRACKWPIGDPSSSDFHFCGAARVSGRPYCPEHVLVAYHKETKRSLKHSPQGSVIPQVRGRN
jgi:GcrA cell cycle regulator